jgi:hypothetical protein
MRLSKDVPHPPPVLTAQTEQEHSVPILSSEVVHFPELLQVPRSLPSSYLPAISGAPSKQGPWKSLEGCSINPLPALAHS